MAITRIHPIKATLQRAVDYIINPDKTEDCLLVDSYMCSPESAGSSFSYYNSMTKERINSNPGYHLIQAFAPGEVSYDEAHRIGIELADKLLNNNHAYVVSTHVDKEHIHNHIIFCSANMSDYSRYNRDTRSTKKIQEINDEICEKHGLSLVKDKQGIAKNYLEWKNIKNGTSWKQQIRDDIDSVIEMSDDYESFIRKMREKGYEITGEELSPEARKYITFKLPGMERRVRGSPGKKSLGENYTKERIFHRINEKTRSYRPHSINYNDQKIINTNRKKFQENIGLMRWAEKKNLKNASSMYGQIGSMTELKKKIREKEELLSKLKSVSDTKEDKLKDMREIMVYVDAYQDNLVYQARYERSTDKTRYLRNHKAKLEIFAVAKDFLEKKGYDLDKTDFGRLSKELRSMESQRDKSEAEFAKIQKELYNLRTIEKDMQQYMKNTGKDVMNTTERKTVKGINNDR